MAMDPQQIYAMIAKLPDEALQQGMATQEAPPMIKLALMTEFGYRQKARQSQSSEPTPQSNMMAEMQQGKYAPYPAPQYVAPQAPMAGIASLPQGQPPQGQPNQGANPQGQSPGTSAGLAGMNGMKNGMA